MADEFENIFTKIYKVAKEKNIPARYIYSRGLTEDGNPLILNGREEIIELIASGVKLIECYDLYKDVIKIQLEDVAYIHIENSSDPQKALEEANSYISTYNKRIEMNKNHLILTDNEGNIPSLLIWKNLEEEETLEDSSLLDRHINFISKIENLAPSEVPSFNKIDIRTAVHNFYVYLDKENRRVRPSDGFNIFNLSNASRDIPVIEWLGESKPNRYKVSELLNHKLYKPKDRTEINTFNIYFYIEHEKSKKNFFFVATLDLTTALMTVELPKFMGHIDVEKLFEKSFMECFPLKIKSKELKNIKGSFLMSRLPEGIQYDVFQALVMSDPLFRNFYYPDVTKTRLQSNKVILNFKTFRGGKNYYTSNYISTSFSVRIAFENVIEYGGESYLQITIRKADSYDSLKTFFSFFKTLVGTYIDPGTEDSPSRSNKIREMFTEYIYSKVYGDDIETITSKNTAGRSKQVFVATSKIHLLQQVNPEMFSYNNARVTNCEKQPIIIDDDEVEAWTNLKVKKEKRQVVVFPPITAKRIKDGIKSFNYVCPSDTNPYITFKKNKIPSKEVPTNEHFEHLKRFPYTPRCSQSKEELDLATLEQYTKTVSLSKKTSSTHETSTFKIRHFGQRGHLLPSITNLFKQLGMKFTQDYYPNFLGVDVSGESFLQAIMNATTYEQDIDESTETRIDEVKEVRQLIANKIKPEVLKQELYDMSLSTISERLANDSYLNSELYYRALEEYFKINIVIFRPEIFKKGSKTSVNPNIIIETPRYKDYHIRSYQGRRKTIFLYKSLGSESDDISSPHYQIITDVDPEEFDMTWISFNRKLFSFIGKSQKTYIWSYDPSETSEEPVVRNLEMLKCRLNPIDNIQWYKILKDFKLVSQYIDGHGKMRCVNLSYEDSLVSLIVLPSAPLNLPFSSAINFTTSEIAQKLLGVPVAVHPSGYWYKLLDYAYGAFIPVSDIEYPLSEYSPDPPIALTSSSDSKYIKYIQFKRSALVLLEMIEFVYRYSSLPLEEWYSQYIRVVDDESISRSQPIWSDMSIFFPIADDSDSAITALHSWWPKIFNGKNFTIDVTPEMNERLHMYLVTLDRNTQGLENNPNYYVKSLIESDLASVASEGNLMFIGEDSFTKWIKLKSKIFSSQLLTRIDFPSLKTEPVLYKDTDTGKIYIFQTLRNFTKQNAVLLADAWYLEGQNYGYDFEADDFDSDDLPPFVIFQFNEDNKLNAVEDYSLSRSEYRSIVNYNGNNYAALLPLL